VESKSFVPHYKIEKAIEKSGIPYTFLRPSFYMQNLNTTHLHEIKNSCEIAVPVGRAKTNFIDVRDIAAVAANVLAESGHKNMAYVLTGAGGYNYYEVAELFSKILGRSITYTDPSALRFLARTIRTGTPFSFAVVMTLLYTSTRSGMADTYSPNVERLLGRPPIELEQYIQDYKSWWD